MSKSQSFLVAVFLIIFAIGFFTGGSVQLFDEGHIGLSLTLLGFCLIFIVVLITTKERIIVKGGDKNRNIRRNTERTS